MVHEKVFVFGTFSGTENDLDVLHTPTEEFGFLAKNPEIQFVWMDGQASPWIRAPLNQSGHFSALLPPGEFRVNIRMPNRQVYLNHKFKASVSGKAYYIGHINLDITRRFVFFVLGGCGYGTVDHFSVSDELEKPREELLNEPHRRGYTDVAKSLLSPLAEGETPSVNSDCGFLK